MLFWLIPLAILLLFIYLFNRTVENNSQWNKNFESLQFSSSDFYKSCEQNIRKRKIPRVEIHRVRYPEGGVTGANREYLHVVRYECIFDICAAPFGAGSFISSWYVEKPSFSHKILRMIPVVHNIVERKTYYQMDTEAVFKSAVHEAVMEAIDELTTTKGVRGLTERERIFPEFKK